MSEIVERDKELYEIEDYDAIRHAGRVAKLKDKTNDVKKFYANSNPKKV